MLFSSVIGLNFDFVGLNIVGFTLYGCYNVALFWIHSVQVRDRLLHICLPIKAVGGNFENRAMLERFLYFVL